MPGTLEVVGHLMLEMGGESARIEAEGDSIVIELPSLAAGRSILRRWSRSSRRQAIGRIHDLLTRAGLTLRVEVGSQTVGLIGPGARPGFASRLLGFGPLEIRFKGLMASYRKQSPR